MHCTVDKEIVCPPQKSGHTGQGVGVPSWQRPWQHPEPALRPASQQHSLFMSCLCQNLTPDVYILNSSHNVLIRAGHIPTNRCTHMYSCAAPTLCVAVSISLSSGSFHGSAKLASPSALTQQVGLVSLRKG